MKPQRLTPSKRTFEEKGLALGDVYCTKEYTKKVVEKLSELEDIEDELGIDLITLFRALENGIYFQDDSNAIVISNPINIVKTELLLPQIDLNDRSFWVCGDTATITLYFKDYGKTWSLTKGELE